MFCNILNRIREMDPLMIQNKCTVTQLQTEVSDCEHRQRPEAVGSKTNCTAIGVSLWD